jgi:hypothetical protein
MIDIMHHAGRLTFSIKAAFPILFISVLSFSQKTQPASPVLHLTFFGSSTCGECMEIKETLLRPLEKQNALKLKIEYRDIEIEKDLALLTAMEKGYHVVKPSPQELYFPDTVLIGYDDIMKNGKQLIESYLSHPEKWPYTHAYSDSTIDTVKASPKNAAGAKKQ